MGGAGASGSIPLFPSDYLTWQSSYGSPTAQGSASRGGSTSTGARTAHRDQGSAPSASAMPDASIPSSSYEISPPCHEEEHRAAELVAKAGVRMAPSRRDSGSQRPRAKRGSLNWLNLTFQDRKLEALYEDYFVDSVLRTDRCVGHWSLNQLPQGPQRPVTTRILPRGRA